MLTRISMIALDQLLGAIVERSRWPRQIALLVAVAGLSSVGLLFLMAAGYLALARELDPPAAAAICGAALIAVALALFAWSRWRTRRPKDALSRMITALVPALAAGGAIRRDAGAVFAELQTLLASAQPQVVVAAFIGLGMGLALRAPRRAPLPPPEAKAR